MKTGIKSYTSKRTLTLAALLTAAAMNTSNVMAAPAARANSATSNTAANLTQEEANEIATEAYLYFYPLISMDLTRRVSTHPQAASKPGLGPVNSFQHMRAFPAADFREVVRPNFDTLYSSAWLDLSKEPLIVSHPDTNGRYFLLPILDMWSDVIAVPGKRTSGTHAKNFAIVGPNWKGTLPADVERINATTQYAWIIGRTQTNGTADYAAVHAVQDGYRITPLSMWATANKKTMPAPKSQTVTTDNTIDLKTPPLQQVNNMSAERYFSYAAELMKVNPPHATDWSQLERMARLGIVAGQSFNYNGASKVVRSALDGATKSGLEMMKAKVATLSRVANGWQMNTDSMGVYGNFYLKRAIVAMVGLGANQPEDAIYPLAIADNKGQTLRGGENYVLRFTKDQLPPVNAFWSVTMYDGEGFQIANPLNRYALGDRDNLKYGNDGSLELYIQPESPGADKEANWLPSPKTGGVGLTMRLYAPKPEAIDGRWNPPAVLQNPTTSVQ